VCEKKLGEKHGGLESCLGAKAAVSVRPVCQKNAKKQLFVVVLIDEILIDPDKNS
jgi:hypothetical protein